MILEPMAILQPMGRPVRPPRPAGGFTLAQVTSMRQNLGLRDDADAATIVAAIAEVIEERYERPPAAVGTTIADVPEGCVAVPRSAMDALLAQFAEVRDAFLDAHAAKFMPENRELWEHEYDRNPLATIAHFEQAPHLHSAATVDRAADQSPDDELYLALFADEPRRS